jgi:gamma-glutamylcyclotransferase (GGCT)/AIG2-like uncharacterized protein YtfP
MENKDYIFVYGLFRDQAKKMLGEVEYIGRDYIPGKLYFVNEFYPGYKPGKLGKVYGDVFIFNPDILGSLDDYEGDEYARKRVITGMGNDCWVYEYNGNVSNFVQIKAGDWHLR